MSSWVLVIGGCNLVLLFFALWFLLPVHERQWSLSSFMQSLQRQRYWLLLIAGVVIVHLFEVNILDGAATTFVGYDGALFMQQLEGNLVASSTSLWSPVGLAVFVFFYIVVYPFTLWFSPLYYLASRKNQAMKTLASGLLIIYLIALPFYLFFPVTNVYMFYSLDSALSTVIPSVDQFFYTMTTTNNCFPSLHTAVTLLVAYTAYTTGNKRYFMFSLIVAAMVIISVMYLAIHWITDVLGGAAIAVGVIVLLMKINKKKTYDSTTD